MPHTDVACVHELVAAQARATPEAVAISGPEQHWTYRQLAGRINAWAHHVRSLGVGRGDLVAVSLPTTPEVIAVLLGVLTAGAAYLPLDPADPAARLQRTVRDTGARMLITDRAPAIGTVARRVVLVDEVRGVRTSVPGSGAGPDDLMYLIYTSGSTGGPKAVMLPHRTVVNYLYWAIDTLALDRGRETLLHSSLAFDFAVTTIYAPLLTGRTVLLSRRGGAPGAGLIESAESDVDLSFVKLTPSHLRLLTASGPRRRTGRWAEMLLLGGEDLRYEDLASWRDGPDAPRVVNEYGPTETSVACAAYEVTGPAPRCGKVPIGTAVSHVRLHVLDEELCLVPPGVPGQLYVGGAAVAYGYWGRPALTAERFVPDPFATEPGARLYATGDLVRELPGGLLEFAGRMDHQVKIRGHRVEPDEVAAELLRIPEVAQAAVIAVSGRLAGYVVPRAGARLPDCAAVLRDTLPGFMVPGTISVLDALPLNATGKLDRASLPAPVVVPARNGSRPPRSRTEQVLAELYAQVLGLPEAGVDDDFLELGGDSMVAVRLQELVTGRLAARLSISTIFTYPRLCDLAEALDRAPAGDPDLFSTDIMRAPRRPVRYSPRGMY